MKNSCNIKENNQSSKNTNRVSVSYHPLYPIWNAMINRCHNENDNGYDFYGGRGIEVCEKWHDINNFLDDVEDGYFKGATLDRIDNDGNYSPRNTRWVTHKENLRNMRRNRIVEYKGEKKTVAEWAEYLGLKYQTLWARLFVYEQPLDKAMSPGKQDGRKYEKIPCEFCSEKFYPRNYTYRFCSKSCAMKSRYA